MLERERLGGTETPRLIVPGTPTHLPGGVGE